MKINIKKHFIVFLALPFSALADPVTLTNPEEISTGDKILCSYEGHGISRSFYIDDSESCPFAKTFDTDSE